MSSFMVHDKPTTGTRARLLAFKSWSKEQQSIHGFGNVDTTKFNHEQLNIVLMKKATATKCGSNDISPPLYGTGKEAKEPDPWLGKRQDWRKKKREFIAFLAKKRGSTGVPLTYLIWSEVEEGEEHHALYDQSNRTLVRTAPLYGTAFQTDNYDLYQLLVSWTSGGMAEAYVDKF